MEKQRRRSVRLRIAVAVVALLMGSLGLAQAQGQTITQVVVLGDSWSDNGNCSAITGPDPWPYWEGRASNGPVAVEYLAQRLGVPLRDFAWCGATTGVGNAIDGGTVHTLGEFGLPGMTTVFQGALLANEFPIDPNALYILWGGGDDGASITSPEEASVAIGQAVTNLMAIVGTLQSLGATQILVLNFPDWGKAPFFLGLGPEISYFFTQVSLEFNEALKASLPPGAHYFDLFSLFSNVIANPEEYGLSNVTDQFILVPGADPNKYFFMDDLHPTTAGHAIIANALYQSVTPTVIIGECNSGVPNSLLSTGFTISDLIAQAAFGAKNHGQFVRAVASITNGLKKSGVITGSQKGAIERCAARQ